MQEIVLLLTGVAGAASAVAYRRLPGRGAARRGRGIGRRGNGQGDAAGRIRSRIGALAAERDILGKAISRVHEDAGLSGGQRDALLAMYQRQLAAVLAKIDRLEEASRYPDLGPVGDGLAELMDQKLSSLDERLHELSARIAAAVPAAAGAAPAASGGEDAGEAAQKSRARRGGKRAAAQEAVGGAGAAAAAAVVGAEGTAQQATLDAPQQAQQQQQQRQQAQQQQPGAKDLRARPASPTGVRQSVKPVEITTLTTIGGGERKFPEVGRPGGSRPASTQAQVAAPPSPPSPPSQAPQQPAAPPSPPSQAPQQPAAPPSPPSQAPQQPAGPGQAKKPGAMAQAAATTAATTAAAAGAAAQGAGPAQHAASPSLPDRLPRPKPLSVPDAEEQEVDGAASVDGDGDPSDDEIAAIVADIRSTLSKLEQAEVE